jgi:protein phosphatase methylesterase 1
MEIFAMDLRGHGESVANAPDAAACESFDPDVMAEDALETLRVFVARRGEEEKTKKTRRKVVVVGHSMGGAIAARLAKRLEELDAAGDGFVEVVGLILIDIVEGSAMAALPAMGALVDARPETFESLEEAMTWSMTKGGGTRNPRSAAISLPSQLRELRVAGGADTSSASRRCRFAWRTNLRATAKYWSDWYTGLSKLYLVRESAQTLVTRRERSTRYRTHHCANARQVSDDAPSQGGTRDSRGRSGFRRYGARKFCRAIRAQSETDSAEFFRRGRKRESPARVIENDRYFLVPVANQ